MVDGRLVKRAGHLLHLDVPEIVNRAEQSSLQIRQEAGALLKHVSEASGDLLCNVLIFAPRRSRLTVRRSRHDFSIGLQLRRNRAARKLDRSRRACGRFSRRSWRLRHWKQVHTRKIWLADFAVVKRKEKAHFTAWAAVAFKAKIFALARPERRIQFAAGRHNFGT